MKGTYSQVHQTWTHLPTLTSYIIPVVIVHIFNFPISKSEFSHPVDTTADSRRQADVPVVGSARDKLETIRSEVIRREVLSVVVGRHVIYVNLITFLQKPELLVEK